MSGPIVTPDASPPISIPLFIFPEKTLVRASWLPPVAVTSSPSLPFGAAPLKARRPPNVLNVMKPAAVPATSMPLRTLPAETFPSGITPPTCVFWDEPSTRMPSPLLATTVELLAPMPKKLPWTTTPSESGDAKAVPQISAHDVVVHERIVAELAAGQRVVRGPDDAHAVGRVRNRRVSVGGRSDEVAVEDIPLRAVIDQNAVLGVARDEISIGRNDENGGDRPLASRRIVCLAGGAVDESRAADLVAVRRRRNPHAVFAVGYREVAVHVGADAVGGDDVAGRPVKAQAVAAVAGDHVCDGARRSRSIDADAVVRRLSGDVNAVGPVPGRAPFRFKPM